MTVDELITALQDAPPDAQVIFCSAVGSEVETDVPIREVLIAEGRKQVILGE